MQHTTIKMLKNLKQNLIYFLFKKKIEMNIKSYYIFNYNMSVAEYNPEIDYKNLHLDWIKKHKNFKPKGGLALTLNSSQPAYKSYYDQMEDMYNNVYKLHKTAYLLLRDDIKHFTVRDDIDEKVNMVLGLTPTEKYFMTFNFHDNNFDLSKIMPAFEKLKSKTYIQKMDAVFEYHGSKENHPHIHMVVEVRGPDRTFGRFKKVMKQTQLYKLLKADNFFDYKIYVAERHEDYIDGNKRAEKEALVAKDKIWRTSLGLEHIYLKN